MQFIETLGIVFRNIKYSETSVIVDIYTEQCGLRSFIVSGVRSPRATIKASLLQVMSLVELIAPNRTDTTLHRLKELRMAHTYQSLPFNVAKGAVGIFMAELARKTIKEEEPNPELFEFVWRSFAYLDSTSAPFGNVHLWFMASLSGFLGFMPHGDWSEKTPFLDLKTGIFVADAPTHTLYMNEESSELLQLLLHTELEQSATIKMNRAQRHVLLEKMLTFYSLHIENLQPLQSHKILQEIME